jgi:hypothetical protein
MKQVFVTLIDCDRSHENIGGKLVIAWTNPREYG